MAHAFKVESFQYLNDLNEGFEVISAIEETKETHFKKVDSTNIVDLKLIDEMRRREAKKEKMVNEFQIILPLNFQMD